MKFTVDRELDVAERGGSPLEPFAESDETVDGRPAAPATLPDSMTVRCCDVWWLTCRFRTSTWVAVGALVVTMPTGCGSGDSTVAKTPQATTPRPAVTATKPVPSAPVAAPTSSAPAPVDPCAVDLAAPAVARAVSELPRDPRSQQPWSPEPLAGNYSECAQLSAVIIKANTNAGNANTRAVMFHLGKYIPQGAPDTFGFNGIDTTQCTGDTVALTYPTGVGLASVVKFHWNGNGVELIGNTG